MTWKRFMQAAINPLWLTCDVGVGNEDFVVRRGSLSPNTELSAKKPPDFFCSSPLSRCAKRIASTSSFAAFILKPPLCSLTLGTQCRSDVNPEVNVGADDDVVQDKIVAPSPAIVLDPISLAD
jgi:hypothetical protein